MRRVQSWIVILVLALVGCAGEPEPDPAVETGGAQPAAPLVQTAVPLTAAELQSYRQELGQMFAGRDAVALRPSATGGVTADIDGHASVALVKVNADGALDTACVDNEQDAERFLTAAGGAEVK